MDGHGIGKLCARSHCNYNVHITSRSCLYTALPKQALEVRADPGGTVQRCASSSSEVVRTCVSSLVNLFLANCVNGSQRFP